MEANLEERELGIVGDKWPSCAPLSAGFFNSRSGYLVECSTNKTPKKNLSTGLKSGEEGGQEKYLPRLFARSEVCKIQLTKDSLFTMLFAVFCLKRVPSRFVQKCNLGGKYLLF